MRACERASAQASTIFVFLVVVVVVVDVVVDVVVVVVEVVAGLGKAGGHIARVTSFAHVSFSLAQTHSYMFFLCLLLSPPPHVIPSRPAAPAPPAHEPKVPVDTLLEVMAQLSDFGLAHATRLPEARSSGAEGPAAGCGGGGGGEAADGAGGGGGGSKPPLSRRGSLSAFGGPQGTRSARRKASERAAAEVGAIR